MARVITEAGRASRLKWRQAHPEKVLEYARRAKLKKLYNITPEQYDEMFEAQDGRCAICRQPERACINGRTPRLHIDHGHESGEVRALLCSECNTGLGKFGEDAALLRAAAEYLERHHG